MNENYKKIMELLKIRIEFLIKKKAYYKLNKNEEEEYKNINEIFKIWNNEKYT